MIARDKNDRGPDGEVQFNRVHLYALFDTFGNKIVITYEIRCFGDLDKSTDRQISPRSHSVFSKRLAFYKIAIDPSLSLSFAIELREEILRSLSPIVFPNIQRGK